MGLKRRIIELWDRVRLVLVAVMTALVLLFALQNLHTVRIDIVLWQVGASASLLVLGSFLVGLIVGGVTTFYYKGRFWSERKARARALADKAAAEERAAAAQLPPPEPTAQPAADKERAPKPRE
ncbi:MAG: LapA family protein [Gemmatimonadota bacterium]|nr:MAG: LapA family protein [Gemmatimonadota bacterium]